MEMILLKSKFVVTLCGAALMPLTAFSQQNALFNNEVNVGTPEGQNESQAAQAAYEERELTQRYNGLAGALNDFMAAYKAGQIDVKKANAVRRALHGLEKFEWLRPQRSAWATTDVGK